MIYMKAKNKPRKAFSRGFWHMSYLTNQNKYSIIKVRLFGWLKLKLPIFMLRWFGYEQNKERNIKEVADYYFGRIPDKLYDGLYNYEVEIDD